MTTPLTAIDLITQVERRIEDPSNQSFSETEILRVADAVMGRLYTRMRQTSAAHEMAEIPLTISSFTSVPNQVNTFDLVLPGWAGDVISFVGRRASGRAEVAFRRIPITIRGASSGLPTWTMQGARPGTMRVIGRLAPYTNLSLWVTRKWAPLHHGTAAAGGASTISFDLTPTAGRVIRNRDDIYNGMDIVLTNNSPVGTQDLIERVTDFVGSTMVATMSGAWPTAPDATTTYAVVVPLPSEHNELLVEEVSRVCLAELGEQSSNPAYLEELRQAFTAGLRLRDQDGGRRVWNYGR